MKVHFIDNVKTNLRKLFFKFIQSITLSAPQLKSSLPTPFSPDSFDLLSPIGLQAHWPPMKNATPPGLELFALPGKFFPGYSLSYFLISSMSLFKCSLLSEAYLNQQVGHILSPHPPSPSTLYLPFLLFARIPTTSDIYTHLSRLLCIICLPLP